jgi:hypothetical protein
MMARGDKAVAFRKTTNRHDNWEAFLEAHQGGIAKAQLPANIFRNEQSLIDFLTFGHSAEESIVLAHFSDRQFLDLEAVVNDYLHDGWYQMTLTVFHKERLRRFGRYA